MAPYSSTLTWKIPWTKEPGRLQSMGSLRVGHDWATELNWITICSDFRAQESKVCHCFHCFPIYWPWSGGTRCHDLSFWMLSFKPIFPLCSFTLINRLFSFSLLFAIKIVSSAYFSLLIFLPAILIPACGSSSLAFLMMYFAYKFNKQRDFNKL